MKLVFTQFKSSCGKKSLHVWQKPLHFRNIQWGTYNIFSLKCNGFFDILECESRIFLVKRTISLNGFRIYSIYLIKLGIFVTSLLKCMNFFLPFFINNQNHHFTIPPTHTQTHTHSQIHTYTHTYTYIHTHTHTHTYTHTWTNIDYVKIW